jgi:hypothetical protein
MSVLDWSNKTSMTVKVPADSFPGASFQWYKDGTPWIGKTDRSITVTARDFTVATGHQLTLKITYNGKVWSKSLTFDVQD